MNNDQSQERTNKERTPRNNITNNSAGGRPITCREELSRDRHPVTSSSETNQRALCERRPITPQDSVNKKQRRHAKFTYGRKTELKLEIWGKAQRESARRPKSD